MCVKGLVLVIWSGWGGSACLFIGSSGPTIGRYGNSSGEANGAWCIVIGTGLSGVGGCNSCLEALQGHLVRWWYWATFQCAKF